MSVANSKKAVATTANPALAGAMTRISRRGGSSRLGRRAALLGVLSSMYANTNRGGVPRTPGEPRTAGQGADRA